MNGKLPGQNCTREGEQDRRWWHERELANCWVSPASRRSKHYSVQLNTSGCEQFMMVRHFRRSRPAFSCSRVVDSFEHVTACDVYCRMEIMVGE